MSQDAPPPDPQKTPLEYWHATGASPMHPALLTLCTLAGMLIGGGSSFALVTMVCFSMLNETPKWLALAPGILIDLLAIGLLIWTSVKIRAGRSLSLENRRRGFRFFAIGLLLGCGIACLIDGICFTVVGVNA